MAGRSPGPFNSVARSLVLPRVAPVAPCSDAVRDRLKVSAVGRIGRDDCFSSGLSTDTVAVAEGDELTAKRGACCPEDAVFSRRSNWVERVFMVVARSS